MNQIDPLEGFRRQRDALKTELRCAFQDAAGVFSTALKNSLTALKLFGPLLRAAIGIWILGTLFVELLEPTRHLGRTSYAIAGLVALAAFVCRGGDLLFFSLLSLCSLAVRDSREPRKRLTASLLALPWAELNAKPGGIVRSLMLQLLLGQLQRYVAPPVLYVWRSIPQVAAATLTVAVFLRITPALVHLPHPPVAKDIYIGEFAGLLAFLAVTVAVTTWRLGSIESRFISQAGYLRERLYEFSRTAQASHPTSPQTQGEATVNGLAEDIERALVFGIAQLSVARIQTHMQYLRQQPEWNTISVSVLVSVDQLRGLWLSQQLNAAALASATSYALYGMATTLGLAIVGAAAEDNGCVWLSVVPVVIAIQGTTRFISARLPKAAADMMTQASGGR